MTLLYPEQVTFDSAFFSTAHTISYPNQDGSNSVLALGIADPGALPSSKASVLVTIEGVTQDTTTYFLTNNQYSVGFYAPVSGNVEMKVITVPERYIRSRSGTIISSINYTTSNSIVNGNSYAINGTQSTFAFPLGVSAIAQSDILIYIDGVSQSQDKFNWPSSTLGTAGVDIIEPPSANSASLEIKVFSTALQSERSANLAFRHPDRGFSEERQFKTTTYESQIGYEKRILLSRRPRRSYDLSYTNIDGLVKNALDNFYMNVGGDWRSFRFSLDHIEQTGEVSVKFDGSIRYTHVASLGANTIDQIYTAQVRMKEVYD